MSNYIDIVKGINSFFMLTAIEGLEDFNTSLYPYEMKEFNDIESLEIYGCKDNDSSLLGQAYYDKSSDSYIFDNLDNDKTYSCKNIEDLIIVINDSFYEYINSVIDIAPNSEYEEFDFNQDEEEFM